MILILSRVDALSCEVESHSDPNVNCIAVHESWRALANRRLSPLVYIYSQYSICSSLVNSFLIHAACFTTYQVT